MQPIKTFSAQMEKCLSQKEHLTLVKSADLPFPGKACPAQKLENSPSKNGARFSACTKDMNIQPGNSWEECTSPLSQTKHKTHRLALKASLGLQGPNAWEKEMELDWSLSLKA